MAEQIVIIGAGQAGVQAVASLRAEGYQGAITMVGDEPFPPYQRPPLSKAYLAGDFVRERLFLRPDSFYAESDCVVRLSTRATKIDRAAKTVHLADGSRIPYSQILICTGTRVRPIPVPGADLLMSNIYDQLMPNVTDTKDLGSGVIGGTECDHFAFRTLEVDWQIWVAQGDKPYPCRYSITSKNVDQGPQYSVQVRDWKADSEVAADSFAFANTTNAKKIDTVDLGDVDELPSQFKGVTQ